MWNRCAPMVPGWVSKLMRRKSRRCTTLIIFAFALILDCILVSAQQYFPVGVIQPNHAGIDSGRAEWYSKQLKALGEPSLYEFSKDDKKHVYRFLWLRTFHHPVAVRITFNADGTVALVTKMCNGAGGYKPGKLIVNKARILSQEEVHRFQLKVEEVGYWGLPPQDDKIGLDGAQWIIEGAQGSKYHFVDRWSPKEGPVRTLGWMMVHDLAALEINNKEIY